MYKYVVLETGNLWYGKKLKKWNKGSEASCVTGRWSIGYLTWTDWTANKVNGSY